MFFPEVPETAIAAFERIHDLRVTVHDLKGSLWPWLQPERFQHGLPLCQAVKAFAQASCFDFEVTRLRREIAAQPQGRVHVCHAGLVEWVAPVFRAETLEWVIFAGVREAAAGLREVTRDTPGALPDGFWNEGRHRPAPVEDEEAAVILESLRQLAARLWLWTQEREAMEASGAANVPYWPAVPDALALRRTLIQRFIAEHHTGRVRLGDLAARLSLSEWRASHAVRECCDTTFQELLAQARLRTAMGLLRHSELSVLDVALYSGFDDVRQFHRQFRRHAGTTPLQYRKTARS